MTVNQKRLAAIFTAVLLLFLFGYWLYPKDTGQPEYIFDKSYDIELADVHKSREHIDFDELANNSSDAAPPSSTQQTDDAEAMEAPPEDGIDLRALFSEGLINSYTTLKFFKHLEHKFRKSTTLGEHFDSVKQYLFSEFSETEARKLFNTYKEYLQCEMDLLEEYKHFSGVQTPEEAIDMLKQIQAFRRQRLGKELADRLFGTDVKAKEYAFRRAAIVRDNTLYGREKEERLAELNKDMWGDESAAVDAHRNAYNQYQETLQIYQKDLDEAASEAARQKKLRQLREEHFSPEVVAKFEEIDQQMDEAAEREKTYREQAGAIESNEALSEAEKEKRIRNLQSEVFGEDAAAFRRREAIRKGREEMKKRSPLTVEDLPQAGQQ
jgi:lipase chaperone LimK